MEPDAPSTGRKPRSRSIESAGDVVISTLAKRETADEFRDIVLLARPDGSLIRTRDVATVRDGFEEAEVTARIDGRPAVFVRVHAGAGQPPQEVAEEVKTFLDGYAPPSGADITLWDDETRIIDFRLSRMSRNGLFGAVLVFIALLLIFDLRMSLWIAVGIPVAFLGSFLLFDAFGLTVNVLTVFAFFLVTGIVVDDAIVVGESIARQRERGYRGAAASVAGVASSAAGSSPLPHAAATMATTTARRTANNRFLILIWFHPPCLIETAGRLARRSTQ